MAEQIRLEQVYDYKKDLVNELYPLWIEYMRELYENDSDVQNKTEEELRSWLNGRIQIQGKRDNMHLEAIILQEEVIGFAMYAVDLGGISHILESGLGYLMELFVMPEHRRKGIGTRVSIHMIETLKSHGVNKVYLTSDSDTGIPFWIHMGFKDSGKIDPDNKAPIYILE